MKTLVLVLSVLAVAGAVQAQECTEEVYFTTSDGSITMHHVEARFNCCASLDIESSQDGYNISFFEWEQFPDGPCFCLCCFGIEATVAGLPAGEYTVTVWKLFNNGNGTWTHVQVGAWSVEVRGQSQPGFSATYVPCTSTAVPDGPGSWGTIKALFR